MRHSLHPSELVRLPAVLRRGCPRPTPPGPSSEADLATAPVAAELVVADLRSGLHAEPLRQRPVLVELLREVLLRLESLHGAHLYGSTTRELLGGLEASPVLQLRWLE